MTEPRSELVAAARHLVQWGRSRQTVWHDPSSDLLAALGNRYASFDHLQAELPPPVPTIPRPSNETSIPVDAPFAPPPAPASRVPTPPPPSITTLPASPPAAIVTPVAVPVRPPVPGPVSVPAATPRRRWTFGRLALAATVILGAAATPSLWHVYESSRTIEPRRNTLTIESTPPGSVVLIDGIESGKTPLTTEIIIGSHQIELRYRKNVRKLDIEVTAGPPVVTAVDWTKRPPSRKRPVARVTASAKGPDAAANTNRQEADTQAQTSTAPRDGQVPNGQVTSGIVLDSARPANMPDPSALEDAPPIPASPATPAAASTSDAPR